MAAVAEDDKGEVIARTVIPVTILENAVENRFVEHCLNLLYRARNGMYHTELA